MIETPKATYKRAYDVMGVHYVVLADGKPIGHIAKRAPLGRTHWVLWIQGHGRSVHSLYREAKKEVDRYLYNQAHTLNFEGESECDEGYEWEDGLTHDISGMVLICKKHRSPVDDWEAYETIVPAEDLRYPCSGATGRYPDRSNIGKQPVI
jgi:hypothetical protein